MSEGGNEKVPKIRPFEMRRPFTDNIHCFFFCGVEFWRLSGFWGKKLLPANRKKNRKQFFVEEFVKYIHLNLEHSFKTVSLQRPQISLKVPYYSFFFIIPDS